MSFRVCVESKCMILHILTHISLRKKEKPKEKKI